MADADHATPAADQIDGLIFACKIGADGEPRTAGWVEIESWKPDDGMMWIHLDITAASARNWLLGKSGLSAPTVSALLEKESRPRAFRGKRGYVAILRGINQNEGAEPEDMVSLRIWCDGHRLITLRDKRLFVPRIVFEQMTVQDIGPRDAPSLFGELVEKLVWQMEGVITEHSDRLDGLELKADESHSSTLSRELADMRSEIVVMRRYIAPQREALGYMTADPPAWLPDDLRPTIREAADRQQRYLEELDALRERAIVIKDDIANRLNEVMNKNMYVISVIAAIFLPLSFLTGLLGINVGGMPGVESSVAFWITCAVMVILLVAELWLFRRLKWF